MSGTPSLAERDALREKLLAQTPGWYHPWLHFAIPTTFGLATIAACVWQLRALRAIELLTVPACWLLANVSEWHAHRDLLHHRFPLAKVLYERHTPEHHMVYVTDDMAMRSRGEFRLVLIPAYGIMMIFVVVLAPAYGLWSAGLPNVALLFVASMMSYVLSYEWLHLAYHLPRSSFVGGLSVVAKLRHLHAVHHDPRVMQRWNFNVTVPIWDWVRGTLIGNAEEGLQRQREAKR